MKNIISIFTAFFICLTGSAQSVITTGNTLTPEQLVNQVLAGQGVTISNVTFNGTAANALAIQPNAFDFTATGFPFSNGIYLRTQNGATISDPDLDSISTNTITNGAILEFDFIPTGDSLNFNYMFASAEYPTFVCSGFNDVFGFFISGPGINGPYTNGAENIALVPGTTVPVAINTVNSGTVGSSGTASTCAAQDPNWTANSVYFTTLYANYSGEGYNGGTVDLPAVAQLQCGQTYHIKLAVSNVGDQVLNSGVYLEGNSFSSNAVNIDVNTVAGDTAIFEGCTDANFIFSRPGSLADTLIVNYDITGTATSGSDYNPLTNPVVFLPGEDSVTITLTPLLDGIAEPGGETVILTAYTISPCGDTLISQGTLWIYDELYLQVPPLDTNVLCPIDSTLVFASVSGGVAPYSYAWTGNSSTTNGAWVNTNSLGTTDYYFTVTDACGYTTDDTLTVNVLPNPLVIDSMLTTPSSPCFPDGSVDGYASGSSPSSTIGYSWTSPQPNNPNSVNTQSWNNLITGWYYLTVSEGNCTLEDSVFVPESSIPIMIDSMTQTPSLECLTTGAASIYVSGASGPVQYSWTSPQPNTPATSSASTWNNILPGWYYCTVTYGSCVISDSVEVTQIPTGFSIDSLSQTPSAYCHDNGAVAAHVSGTNGSQQYFWTSPQANSPTSVTTPTWNGLIPGWYYCTVTYGSCVLNDSVQVTQLPNSFSIDSLSQTPSSSCHDNGTATAHVSGTNGSQQYLWTSPQANNPNSVTTPTWNDLIPGWYYCTVTYGSCVLNDSVQVMVNPAPIASAVGANVSGCVPLTASFANTSQNATSYEWDFGNSVINVNNTDLQTETFTSSTTVMLVAFSADMCSDTTYIDVEVIPCGCTDPSALNYSPLASIEDGSCIYPTPIVVCPNIFTPNNDNSNDEFFLDVTNAVKVEYTIINRWGNLIFEISENGTNPTPKWDGKTKDGSFVNNGTYFVKYQVTGIDGTTINGQNFVQVVSKN